LFAQHNLFAFSAYGSYFTDTLSCASADKVAGREVKRTGFHNLP
jgi:hypothetical protein